MPNVYNFDNLPEVLTWFHSSERFKEGYSKILQSNTVNPLDEM